MKNIPVHQIAPYLPFKVKAMFTDSNKKKVIGEVSWLTTDGFIGFKLPIYDVPKKYKLILYPLTELFENIGQHEAFTDCLTEYELSLITDHVLNKDDDCEFLSLISYSAAQYLFKHHFDVFGLIQKSQAVDGSKLKFSIDVEYEVKVCTPEWLKNKVTAIKEVGMLVSVIKK